MEAKGRLSLRLLAWTHFPAPWYPFLSWGQPGRSRFDEVRLGHITFERLVQGGR